MKETIKNNFSKYISIFLLISPIIDLLTGITRHISSLNISVGIIKILFLLFIVCVYLFIYKKKKLIPIYILIGIYSIMYIIGIYLYNTNLFINTYNMIKVMYFPVLLITLYELREHIKISNMTIFTSIYLYLILIFIPLLLNMGYNSYKITKVGSAGLYNSANEISGLIGITTPILFIIFKENRKILNILLIIIYLFIITTIGTKTPLLSLLITLLISIIYIIKILIKNKSYKKLITLLVLLISIISISILVIPKTNFYKNINTHINYLNIDNIDDIKDPSITDHLIFSQRLTFLKDRIPLYNNSNIYSKLFGTGYTYKNKVLKTIEIDYFDIYISQGLIGFIIVISIFLYIMYKLLKPKKITNYNDLMYITSILLIVLLSIFTGHILTAPSVSFLVGIILLNINNHKKKDLLFTSVNLDIGGIEKALVNLVNRIDSNKYNIEIILEDKKGSLLDQINKNIIVKELKVSNNSNILIRKITNYLRKLSFKIINYHNYDFSCCYGTYSYSSSKLALIGSSNNSFYVHSDYRNVYKDDKDFYNFFNSRNINNYKYILFVSNESKNGFIEKYKDLKNRCHVFNNFINTDEIIKLSKDKIKEKTKNKLLVFVGRLDESSKKITRQINLIKELDNIDLWIIGDGPDKDKYIKEVKDLKLTDRILFLGRKNNPYPYMNKADYILLTSDYEGFPVTYLEAITLNKRIITTIPTSDDIVDINDYGDVISKDKDKMIKEVKKIIKEDKKVEKIDLEIGQINRMKELEKIFDGVI